MHQLKSVTILNPKSQYLPPVAIYQWGNKLKSRSSPSDKGSTKVHDLSYNNEDHSNLFYFKTMYFYFKSIVSSCTVRQD